ncbi:MAG: M28 family peptidase [Bdellovibrionales bacterium]|nr:M28 family peptidase [Bdellovibrionales bacterium]
MRYLTILAVTSFLGTSLLFAADRPLASEAVESFAADRPLTSEAVESFAADRPLTSEAVESFAADRPLVSEAVNYLASDRLEGRLAGSEGNRLATEYLAEKLIQLGVKPLGRGYRQKFTIFTAMEKSGPNHLTFGNNGSKAPFEPLPLSASGSIGHLPIVFAGFGITTLPSKSDGFSYDDYSGVDVKGKIVAIFTSDPALGNENSPFRNPQYLNYRSISYKLKNAQTHGAAAVVLLNNPLSIGDLSQEEEPKFDGEAGGGERFDLLAGYSTNRWLNSILKRSTTLQLQQQIAQTSKPNSFVVGADLQGSVSVNLTRQTGQISNLVGVIPGSDPEHTKEVVVLAAHFDHLGYGSTVHGGDIGQINNGADDNASGSALVLDLAKQLVELKPQRTHLIVLFNAEEMGLLGARALVGGWSRYVESVGQIYAAINFDMVGRLKESLAVVATGSALQWGDYLAAVDSELTLSIQAPNISSSDHSIFIDSKIPSLFFTTGAHRDYHRATDDVEKINFTGIARISDFAFALLAHLDRETLPLTFDPSIDQDGAPDQGGGTYTTSLGCIPDFVGGAGQRGILCQGAVPGSPAASVGISKGDLVTKIGEIDIKSIYDLTFALKFYRPGDQVLLSWMRNGEEKKATIILVARQ